MSLHSAIVTLNGVAIDIARSTFSSSVRVPYSSQINTTRASSRKRCLIRGADTKAVEVCLWMGWIILLVSALVHVLLPFDLRVNSVHKIVEILIRYLGYLIDNGHGFRKKIKPNSLLIRRKWEIWYLIWLCSRIQLAVVGWLNLSPLVVLPWNKWSGLRKLVSLGVCHHCTYSVYYSNLKCTSATPAASISGNIFHCN